MFLSLQRKIIYRPTKVDKVDPEEAGLDPARIVPLSYLTRDGLDLQGWQILPEKPCDSIPDTILFFQGRERHRGRRGKTFQALTDLGLQIFVFDYRGFADNPGSPSEDHFARDAHSLWENLTRQRNIDRNRIIIYGESLGGGVATRLASELSLEGTPPAGLVLCATFSSLLEAGIHNYPWLPVRTVLREIYPSQDLIPGVTCPILMVHGALDQIVPLALAEKLFAAAPPSCMNGIPKRMHILPAAGHNDIQHTEPENYRAAIANFLRHLKG
ncbi:MAG: alpha/beta hydrolase [Planctomycetales bacterium]